MSIWSLPQSVAGAEQAGQSTTSGERQMQEARRSNLSCVVR